MRACLACFLFSFLTMRVAASDIELSASTRSKKISRVEIFKQRKEKKKEKTELEKQEARMKKELGDQAVWDTFALIRRGDLAAAERKLLEDPLLPDFASVDYEETQQEGPFRRVSFSEALGGKSYLWGSLAIAYLSSWMEKYFSSTVYLKATESFRHISEDYYPKVYSQVKKALNDFARKPTLGLDEFEEIEDIPPQFLESFDHQEELHPLSNCI